ncbi:hypothetical protein NQ317_006741 [Molorchus minor]|uniref:Uncharacterized protein n=1 Tax=Molorchus minor TaxID=1323400 RepID=A0ABQ9IRZ3_9CUCU|nr:hypothetical protein NQ317_006741 [Molorchus minor]
MEKDWGADNCSICLAFLLGRLSSPPINALSSCHPLFHLDHFENTPAVGTKLEGLLLNELDHR